MFIVGMLIGYIIMKNTYVVYHGPDSNIIRKKVFHNKNRNFCYKLVPKVHICPSKYHNK